MQAAMAAPVDFALLKSLSPQPASTAQSEPLSENRKSFDEMVSEAAYREEKTEIKAEEPVQKNEVQESLAAEKQPVNEGSVLAEKKNSENTLEKNRGKPLHSEKKLVEQLKLSQIAEKSEDSEILQPVQKMSVNFSSLELKEILSELEKNAPEEEKNALSCEDLKVLLEDDQESLAATVVASESMLKNQNSQSLMDLAQVSENIFQPEGESFSISDVAEKKTRTFAFDKDGKIIVTDYRSDAASEKNQIQPEEKSTEKHALKVSEVKINGNNAELTMEVASNVQQNVTSSNSQVAGANGSNFQAMLANQIQQNAGEIVKAGSIVLKDNDVGSVKLILKPESLGNVKVDLHISDKNITGRIVVATQEAFNAFKESADSLKQAFLESGFENAGFELAFAGQNASGNGAGDSQENPAARFRMNHSYGDLAESGSAQGYEEEVSGIVPLSSVNIVA